MSVISFFGFTCQYCSKEIQHGLDGYLHHLQRDHGFTVKRGAGQTGFVCGQDLCKQTFKFFFNLRKHFKKCHMSANEGEGNAFVDNGDHEFEDGQAKNDRVQVNVVEVDAIEEDGHGLDSQFDQSAAVVQR